MERGSRGAYPDVRIFGSALRTAALVAVELLGTTHLSELARALGVNRSAVQRVIQSLEREGLIAGRVTGSERKITLNPTYYAAVELRAFLRRIGDAVAEYPAMLSTLRRRPRRTGK